MAFVYRSERNLGDQKTSESDYIGPGSYIGHHNYRITVSKVPFNTQQTRSPDKKVEKIPGPGSYNAATLFDEGQKVVLQSGNSEVRVLELPKPSSTFKSQTQRFLNDNAQQNPGPGNYFNDEHLRQNQVFQRSSTNIIQQIMKVDRHYQPIPSIPTSVQLYGYTEKQNRLELNKPPYETHSGLENDSVGPGQYQLKDKFVPNSKQDQASWWGRSQTAKIEPVVSKYQEQLVGPGNYDVDPDLAPIYKMKKASHGFISKTKRIFDQRKGIISQKVILNGVIKKDEQFMGKAFDEESEDEEYVDDATPGPGHYFHDYGSLSTTASAYSFNQRSKSESRFQIQQARQERFKDSQVIENVGPGLYEISTSLIKKSTCVKNPPFLSSDTKFQIQKLEKRPGPQHYDQKIKTLENDLIINLHKSPIGNFGINVERFQESCQKDPQPGPGEYILDKPQIQDKIQASFKSKTIRNAFTVKKDILPHPGTYDIDNFTIAKKVRVEEEQDPDLAIKRPPFNVAEERFKQEEVKKNTDEDCEENRQTVVKDINDLFIKKPVKNCAFDSKSPRFKYKSPDKVPGPGEYHDPKKNLWNQRTFNVIFADV